jgi:amino acid permease
MTIKNVIAAYIGVILYIAFFVGYTVYELLTDGKKPFLVPLDEVDLVTDAVWKPGDGDIGHKRERHEEGQDGWLARLVVILKRI